MPVQYGGDRITFSDGSNLGSGWTGFKNRIINGDMGIDQRNNGASVTPATGAYTLDRWRVTATQSSKFSVQQNAGSVTPPVGFTNYLGVTSLAATTVGSTDDFNILQFIEGFNVADLAWGTANAAPISLSFWVRSSLTGTFGGAVSNSGASRSYPFTYTISNANTWEYKTISIAGDTVTALSTGNGIGLRLMFGLGVGATYSGAAGAWASGGFDSATGATSVVGTNGATWYITGVQLEKGSTATSFDYLPYGTELQLCYRYYYKIFQNAQLRTLALGYVNGTTESEYGIPFPVTMRTRPTALETTGTASNYRVNSADANYDVTTITYRGEGTEYMAKVRTITGSGLTAGYAAQLMTNTGVTTGFLAWSAEL